MLRTFLHLRHPWIWGLLALALIATLGSLWGGAPAYRAMASILPTTCPSYFLAVADPVDAQVGALPMRPEASEPKPREDLSLEEIRFMETHEITRGDSIRPCVALTLDDGWDREWIERAIAFSRKERVRFTAFLPGLVITHNPDLVAEMVRLGWEIGNHSYDHQRLTQIPEDQVTWQFTYTMELMDKAMVAAGLPLYRMQYFRTPSGWKTEPVDRVELVRHIAAAEGMQSVTGTRESVASYGPATKEAVVTALFKKGFPNGAIVVMHFVKADVEALPEIVARLRAEGKQLVTLSEVLSPGQRYATSWCGVGCAYRRHQAMDGRGQRK